ncbi:pilus assembly protein [Bordetella pseudohinzii]|uniref:Pilus assembly protein n=1 Tax=Bordetella pseudohinzii TaxID=1331258 RepID=A0ABN4RXD9_9BORD|nr:pilus assembly protein [Bordetella pseudohinzii]KMM25544.1 pilus assembly protein [Bordetella pseudohinzii]KXA76813.1 pilus assembly protein [Bordetella pseudohinzii]KXA77012.1 pilus assembly protein [Bordetella pseudohinzii]
MAVWPGHTLMVHQSDACHVLLSLRPRPGGGTTGSQSRLCAARPAASAGVEPLGRLAELLHAHAEGRVTVSVWSLPLGDTAASQWLERELRSRGWRPSGGAWVRGDARLDTFLTRLDAGAAAASGLVLVRHHD